MKGAFLLAMLVLLAIGCTRDHAPLVVTDVSIKKPVPGMQMSAGYLTFTNDSAEPITITRITSPQFAAVEMHETIVQDGISRMAGLDELTIPARSQVVFEPGGKHLMLMRPTGALDAVSLDFYSGDALLLSVQASAAE